MVDHTLRVYDSMMGLLSGEDNPTPLVRLAKTAPFQNVKIYGKLEWYNPFGAVKDRVAANLVADAEGKKTLTPGLSLVEPTSGNTGLGLAMIGNAKGYPLRTPLSSAIPIEKRAVLKFFGTDLVELDDTLCPAPGAPEGAIALAMETAQKDPQHFRMLNQYENEANPGAHYKTTGPEIWKQTKGTITHFFAALGTCGTITGTSRFLKEKNPNIKVYGIHPTEGHDIPGVRSIRQLKQTRFFNPEKYDGLVEITNDEAYKMCLRLNREESIIAGPSSGMALAGALKILKDDPKAVAVVMFPDNIFKYASSIQRHFPEMFATLKKSAAAPGPKEQLLDKLLENARANDTIEIAEVEQRVKQPNAPVLIDVRDSATYQKTHVKGAINIPNEDMTAGHPNLLAKLPGDRQAPIITVCNSGRMSLTGMLLLKSLGYKNVRSMNGGTIGWKEKGLPTE